MTVVDRDEVLAFADEHGAMSASEKFSVPASTIRSWRSRAERKVTDRRARDPEPDTAGESEAEIRARWAAEDALVNGLSAETTGQQPASVQLVDVQIPAGGWDGGMGCETKVPAKARLIPKFVLGSQVTSTPNRDLGVPADDAVGLSAGAIVLLGSESHAAYSAALWEIVEQAGTWREKYRYLPSLPRPSSEATSYAPTPDDPDHRAGWRLIVVRPARLRAGMVLSADGSRIVPGTPAGRGATSIEERLKNWDGQLDPYHDREQIVREARERAGQVQRDHPPG